MSPHKILLTLAALPQISADSVRKAEIQKCASCHAPAKVLYEDSLDAHWNGEGRGPNDEYVFRSAGPDHGPGRPS